MTRSIGWMFCLVGALFAGCGVEDGAVGEHDHSHGLETVQQAIADCTERQDTGYVRGAPYAITVVTVDGKPVERDTANAYWVMQQAAAAQGVSIRIVSGFRTQAQQQYLYNCYINGNCNNGNLAARPGYSNHQSGHALDLNTSSGGVYNWLAANAVAFGFKRTVSSEPWHWEWWGGGPGGGICGVCEPHCKDGSTIVDRHCGEGNCAAYGSKCVDDELGVRCSFVFCPDQGEADVCLDEATIGHCDTGAIATGDCSAYAAVCSSATGTARCASVFCVEDAATPPLAHDGCFFDGTISHCDANGALTTDACPAGQHCTVWPEVGCTSTPVCPPDGEVSVCASAEVLGHCNFGSMMEAESCADQGAVCVESQGTASCVAAVCLDDAGSLRDGDVCLDDGSVATCAAGDVENVRRCEDGSVCDDGVCVPDRSAETAPSEDRGGRPGDDGYRVIEGRGGCAVAGPGVGDGFLLLLAVIFVRRR